MHNFDDVLPSNKLWKIFAHFRTIKLKELNVIQLCDHSFQTAFSSSSSVSHMNFNEYDHLCFNTQNVWVLLFRFVSFELPSDLLPLHTQPNRKKTA